MIRFSRYANNKRLLRTLGMAVLVGHAHNVCAQADLVPDDQNRFYVQAGLAASAPQAHRDAELNTAFAWETLAGFQWLPALSLEVRIAGFTGAEDSGADNVGTYTLDLSAVDAGVGVRWQSPPLARQWRLQVRGGVLRYQVKAELDEQFYDLREGGKDSQTERGAGAYLGAGAGWQVANRVQLEGMLYYTVRRDLFKDSPNGFDLNDWRLALAAQYRF